ncbi:hypothetical protein PtrM4_068760 [Pyrenophora tritici-repentis]|uniref:Uncharacterized protein n=1 Tax=Pyrenophora tritici-repentis TaxID=45151 RepID=A0A834S856_9PLEO|nr:hypothetical protein PtrM4_068760 [Pyrenophora tritici-repentis]
MVAEPLPDERPTETLTEDKEVGTVSVWVLLRVSEPPLYEDPTKEPVDDKEVGTVSVRVLLGVLEPPEIEGDPLDEGPTGGVAEVREADTASVLELVEIPEVPGIDAYSLDEGPAEGVDEDREMDTASVLELAVVAETPGMDGYPLDEGPAEGVRETDTASVLDLVEVPETVGMDGYPLDEDPTEGVAEDTGRASERELDGAAELPDGVAYPLEADSIGPNEVAGEPEDGAFPLDDGPAVDESVKEIGMVFVLRLEDATELPIGVPLEDGPARLVPGDDIVRDTGIDCALLLKSVTEAEGTYPGVVFGEVAELAVEIESELLCEGTVGLPGEVPY